MAGVSNRQLLESCLIALNELHRRAKTDQQDATAQEATDYLFRLAGRGPELLFQLAEKPSPFLLQLAHANAVWPGFWCPRAEILRPANAVWERLDVGIQCQDNVSSSSKWSWDGEARKWAWKIIQFVHGVRIQVDGHKVDHPGVAIEWTPLTKAAYELPPRSKETVRRYMEEVGKPLIMDITQGRPEEDPALRKMVDHWDRNKSAKPGTKTATTNLRIDIFRSVEQALRDMTSAP